MFISIFFPLTVVEMYSTNIVINRLHLCVCYRNCSLFVSIVELDAFLLVQLYYSLNKIYRRSTSVFSLLFKTDE